MFKDHVWEWIGVLIVLFIATQYFGIFGGIIDWLGDNIQDALEKFFNFGFVVQQIRAII